MSRFVDMWQVQGHIAVIVILDLFQDLLLRLGVLDLRWNAAIRYKDLSTSVPGDVSFVDMTLMEGDPTSVPRDVSIRRHDAGARLYCRYCHPGFISGSFA